MAAITVRREFVKRKIIFALPIISLTITADALYADEIVAQTDKVLNPISNTLPISTEIKYQSDVINNIEVISLTQAESQKTNDNAVSQESSYITVSQTDTETSLDQQPESTTEKTSIVKLDKVEVTGTHIKRTDIEGTSPVLVIDREKIDQTGSTTLSELLRRLPINYGDTYDDVFFQGFAPGSSGMSLRGLGQQNTLILLNGQRLANYGFAQDIKNSFVDLSSIPLSAIERVEILKDGASAIYGSDAIAGVVNIILRKDYEGSEIALTYGGTSEGDGNETILNLISGWNTEKSNLTLVFDYLHRSSISRADRDFSKSADHTTQGGDDFRSIANPVANVFDPFVAGDFVGFFGVYDFNPHMTLVPETERFGAIANYTLELNPELLLFAEIGYSQVNTDFEQAPTPLFDEILVGAGQAFNTYGVDVFTLWRMDEWGKRLTQTQTNNELVVLGLEGIVQDWDWKATANFNQNKTVLDGQNYVSVSALQTAVDNDLINPFGTSANSLAAIDATKATIQRTGISELYGADVITTGEITQTDAGPLSLAMGIGWRHESLEDTPDSLTEQGDVVGVAGTSTSGDRDIGSIFAEFSIPVIETVEMQLAVRYEDYSDFGNATSPKVGLRYQPTRNWLLRGSWGQGFRAPTLPELHLGPLTFFDSVIYNAAPADAIVNVEGNPNLDPTDSESWFLGALWEPVESFTIQLDYWNYIIENAIDQDPQYTVDNFPGRVTEIFPGLVAIDSTFFNIANIETDGLDFDIRYRWDVAGAGTFTVGALATYLLSFDRQKYAGQPWEDLRGTYRYPDWRATIPFTWNRQVYGASLIANYIDSYDDTVNSANPDNKVDSLLTWDAQFVYTGFRKTTITLGVKNITDEDPPFANEEVGYDFATHDPRGRFLYGTFAYKF